MKQIISIKQAKVGDYFLADFSPHLDTFKKNKWYGKIKELEDDKIWCDGWVKQDRKGLFTFVKEEMFAEITDDRLICYILTEEEYNNLTKFARELASL